MGDMTVLIVGGGGREHALAWAVSRSARLGALYVAPGNAGTAAIATNAPVAADDIPALVSFAHERAVDLTIVGPEVPLAAGIVDAFRAAGLRIFGPAQAAAQMEASKEFAKAFMDRHGIPTGDWASFTDYDAARAYLDALGAPVVIKADGLAAGKGVMVCDTLDEARAALDQIMIDGAFGSAGGTVLI